jgi:hypothetical protein
VQLAREAAPLLLLRGDVCRSTAWRRSISRSSRPTWRAAANATIRPTSIASDASVITRVRALLYSSVASVS